MSSRNFRIEFVDRRADVMRYLSAIILAERMVAKLAAPARHEAELRMFRAGGLLIIYNAVEATARAGIEAIYDEIALHQTPFDSLRSTLRKRILRDFKANFGHAKADRITQIAVEVISNSFENDKLFSGNVDAKEIREQAADYGFSTDSDFRLTAHGRDLLTVKNRRNSLAHGLLPFRDVGREFPGPELFRLGRRTMNYLDAILVEIDGYLDQRAFLEHPPTIPAAPAAMPIIGP